MDSVLKASVDNNNNYDGDFIILSKSNTTQYVKK